MPLRRLTPSGGWIVAERLTGTDDLAEALKRARATGLPYVIEITVD